MADDKLITTETRYNWNQPACNTCWGSHNPGRTTHKLVLAQEEVCCFCGTSTKSGVYVRVDPRDIPFPTRLKG